jgi:RHS repeat-associated protein
VVEDEGSGGLALEYEYDVEGRLTEVRRDGVVTESYTYDPNGQRLSASVGGVSISPITWDARDRLTQYGGTTYGYDALGRRKTRTEAGQTTTYTYDLLGALRAVDLPGAAPDIEYVIDGAGRRVGRKVGGVLERTWVYLDDLHPIVEKNGSGDVTRVFVYGAGRVPNLMVIPAGQPDAGTYRILTDHLGSVRRIVNVQTGAIVQALDYDAFGNVLTDTSPGFQPFGFAGGLYDPATGLVRFGARDYDAEIGQWTARDPIGFEGGDGNLYAYVTGNPVDDVDPEGLQADSYSATCRRHPAFCRELEEAGTAPGRGLRPPPRAGSGVRPRPPSPPRPPGSGVRPRPRPPRGGSSEGSGVRPRDPRGRAVCTATCFALAVFSECGVGHAECVRLCMIGSPVPVR